MADFVYTVSCYILALIFILSIWDKLAKWQVYLVKIKEYNILPENLVAVFGWLSLLVELLLAFYFLTLQVNLYASMLFTLLMLIYTGAVSVNIYKGNTLIACGCGGVLENDRLSLLIVYRNLALVLIGVGTSFLREEFMVHLPYFHFTSLLISVSILMVYGVLVTFFEQLKLIKNLRMKLSYFED
ncbi:hypothetical protein ERJ70_00325 [Sediminibacillus dalangtanensis]|uniref:Methylamine utilisation protein MauE domain-containing protein n=1 Tax=Sediminibacillus dalangtanensis TaxID=2729421 RepID=A0ABX7VM85_9BACI|nr:MauE/DoxX family redox-associated membrane protein [Sediminibacillus dalangtanensis]QTM97919.1 hypothetical protein ERJ70_00325 [Sediminibacillus dalangtanensis]